MKFRILEKKEWDGRAIYCPQVKKGMLSPWRGIYFSDRLKIVSDSEMDHYYATYDRANEAVIRYKIEHTKKGVKTKVHDVG